MKLLVLGATGGTGIQLITRSLEHGHSVTAFVRSADSLNEFRDRIEIRLGNVLDKPSLTEVLKGQDAVLSGFGPRLPIAKKDKHLLRDFARVLTGAMADAGVKRAIIISTAFLFKDSIVPPTYLLGKLLFPGVVADSADLEAIVSSSDLNWTLVRPPQLTDAAFTGRYRVRLGHLPRFGFRISRANVADYFVRVLGEERLMRKIVGVSE